MKREIRIVINCDEGFVADTLREFAGKYEDEFGDWHECEHGSGFLEFVEVPDPEPSLADVFDKKVKDVADKREAERKKRLNMLDAERKYVHETAEKLAFLRERRFKVSTYDGGLLDGGMPYTYVRIEKGCRWVEIHGSSVRRTDGRINQASPYIAPVTSTMEELIKTIAEW